VSASAPLLAQTWPARHKLHKYWGKKPADVVQAYVDRHTRPGDVVLDPFCGSGVAVLEASLSGRRAHGFDLNPFAVRLTRALLSPPDRRRYAAAARRVLDGARELLAPSYETRCRRCGLSVQPHSFAYRGLTLCDVQLRCTHCAVSQRVPVSDEDVERVRQRHEPPRGTPDAPIFYGWQMRKLERRALGRWSELFTPRNYRAAGILRDAIRHEPDDRARDWLELTLTATLAQLSRMISDPTDRGGGASWKINSYWLPERSRELHPIQCFENRVRKSLAALDDLHVAGIADRGPAQAAIGDARRLPLADASVDYVFTDPPYGGEGVQYLELSLLWCVWLGLEPAFSREITHNPKRGLSGEDYQRGLESAFREVGRVLRPGRFATVTFANRDPRVVDGLLTACHRAGLELVDRAPMARSAPSLTETTAPRATKADLVLTFRRA
jgi:adenine-specific DNA methylase